VEVGPQPPKLTGVLLVYGEIRVTVPAEKLCLYGELSRCTSIRLHNSTLSPKLGEIRPTKYAWRLARKLIEIEYRFQQTNYAYWRSFMGYYTWPLAPPSPKLVRCTMLTFYDDWLVNGGDRASVPIENIMPITAGFHGVPRPLASFSKNCGRTHPYNCVQLAL